MAAGGLYKAVRAIYSPESRIATLYLGLGHTLKEGTKMGEAIPLHLEFQPETGEEANSVRKEDTGN